MIEVFDIVDDSDLGAPEPFTVIRSIKGRFVLGGFTSDRIEFEANGPVQPATDKEISMLPVADIIGLVKAFWATQPLYVVRGTAPVPSVHEEVPQGAIPGSDYVLSEPPPNDSATIIQTGNTLDPEFDYIINGTGLTLTNPTIDDDWLFATWPVTANVELAESDILVYAGEQYRVLAVKRYPGSGYWKAFGTRMSPQ